MRVTPQATLTQAGTSKPRDTQSETHDSSENAYPSPRVVDGGVTATGVLSRQRGNLITIGITQY